MPNLVYEFLGRLPLASGCLPRRHPFGILWVNLDGPATIHAQIVEMAEKWASTSSSTSSTGW